MYRLQSICLGIFMAALGPPVFAQTEETLTEQPVVAPDPSANLSAPAKELIRLADSGQDKTALLTYVYNSAQPFHLTADHVIYLRDVGIDTEVITAMLKRDMSVTTTPAAQSSTNAPAPEAAAPVQEQAQEAPLVPTPDMTVADTAPADVAPFYDSLSPYGSWVNVENQGWAWQPNVAVTDVGWQPYCDAGRWVWSDCGWYWASDYSWGWAPFHYGRWWRSPNWGWVWYPGQQWAPSWVTWRTYGDYCGWAPLPPNSFFVGSGFSFNNGFVGFNFGFGLTSDCFTFTTFPQFFHHDFRHHRVSHHQADQFFHRSKVVNDFTQVNHNVVANHGVPVDRVSHATGRAINSVPVVDAAQSPRVNSTTRRGVNGDILTATRVPLNTVQNQPQQTFVAQRLSPASASAILPSLPSRLRAQELQSPVNAQVNTTPNVQQPTVQQPTVQQPRSPATQPRTAGTDKSTTVTSAPTNPKTGTQVNPVQSGPPLWNGRRNVPSNERQLWNQLSGEKSVVLPLQQNPRGDVPVPTTPSDIKEPSGAATKKSETAPPAAVRGSQHAPTPTAPAPSQLRATPSVPSSRAPTTETVTPRGSATAPPAQLPRSGDVAVPPSSSVRHQSTPAMTLPRVTESIAHPGPRSSSLHNSSGASESSAATVAPSSASRASSVQIPAARPSAPVIAAPSARSSAPAVSQRFQASPSVSQSFRGASPSFSSRTFGSSPSQAFHMSAPSGTHSSGVGLGSSSSAGARGSSMGGGSSRGAGGGGRGGGGGAGHR